MDDTQVSRRILTWPNLISAIRIAAIPVYTAMIVDRDTTFPGLILFGLVCVTDWVDGYVARRTGQVTELGKILDPVADRLAVATGLIALVVRGAFPTWAAAFVVGRDLLLLLVGVVAFLARRVRIDVRRIGKRATLLVMLSIGGISWGTLGYAFAPAFGVFGWACYVPGIVGGYVAAFLYLGDLRRALRDRATVRPPTGRA
jgi:cardiolipin synthase